MKRPRPICSVHRLVRGRATRPRAGWLLLAIAVALPAGCQTTGGEGSNLRAGVVPASERLLSRAQLESTQPPAGTAEVPPPPGVDREALRIATTNASKLSFEDALADVYDRLDPLEDLDRIEEPVAEPLTPDAEAEALSHYLKGRQAAHDQKYLVAITELRKALQLDPSSTSIQRELARSYLAVNSVPSAVLLFQRILVHEPDDPEAIFNIGLLLAERGDYDQATAVLARAWRDQSRGPRFPHDSGADTIAYSVLATSFRQLGYDRAAIEAAARAALVQLGAGALYARRLEVIYRQRAELWRNVGDGYCRLGQYGDALAMYGRAASLPNPDPGALTPRVVYANLRLDRPAMAQLALLGALRSDQGIRDREIGLCRYVAEHAGSVDDLAEAVEDLYRAQPDSAAAARAAAVLLPEERAIALLREFLNRRPRDVVVVSQLLRWMSDQDLDAAAALAVELVGDHPDLAEENLQRLIMAGPMPSALIDAARKLPPSPARTHFETRMLALLDAVGP
ncbi:MAG: tetratricopeptide repeat protein, partial [Planctomycetota bacterium]